MNVFLWNAHAQNGHVEATLNHPFPAQAAKLEKGLAAGDVFDMVDTSAVGFVTFKELARALTTSAQVNRFLHECGDAKLQKFCASGMDTIHAAFLEISQEDRVISRAEWEQAVGHGVLLDARRHFARYLWRKLETPLVESFIVALSVFSVVLLAGVVEDDGASHVCNLFLTITFALDLSLRFGLFVAMQPEPWALAQNTRSFLSDAYRFLDFFIVFLRAAKGCEIPNFKGPYLGRFPLVLADFWTSDHLSERSRT